MSGEKTISLELLDDRILVQPEKMPKTTKSGLALPENTRVNLSNLRTGKVVAVGPGRHLDDGTVLPMRVKVGDRLVFHKHTGERLFIDDNVLLFMGDRDIGLIIGEDVPIHILTMKDTFE